MKKIYLLLLTVIIAAHGFAQTAVQPFGSGASTDPWQIATLANLYWVTQHSEYWQGANSYFIQTADIDASSTSTWPGGGFPRIGIYVNTSSYTPFYGSYNGKGHTISGIYISSSNSDIGMFGLMYSGGRIDSLGLINVNITGGNSGVGGLVGQNFGGTINCCYTTGNVTCTIMNGVAGGLVGWNYGDISRCYSTVTVSSPGGGGIGGGLIGENTNGSVINCYSTGSVTTNGYVSYAYTGGFVGYMNGGSINYCYSTGYVGWSSSTNSLVGGLVAGYSATANNCFWDMSTSGRSASAGGTGKNTSEMKTQSTFTDGGWDFTTTPIWAITPGVNNNYPYLVGVTPVPPANLTVSAATGIGLRQATLNGTAQIPSGESTTVRFLIGTSSGVYTDSTDAVESPVSGTTTINVSLLKNGLAGGTLYYYRAAASNSLGYARSSELTFTTLAPSNVSATAATGVGLTQATLNGTVQVPGGVSTDVWILWGTTSHGYTDSLFADQSPVSGTGSTSVSKLVNSLTNSTTYYYCIAANNADGYVRSNEMNFATAHLNAGKALKFDGINDCVALPSTLWNNNFSNGTAITVEYWFKGTYLASPFRAQDGGGFFVAGWVTGGNVYHIISTDGSTGAGLLVGPYSTVNDNTWHHIAMTWQKNGLFTSYLDGNQVAQRTAANANLPAINATNYLGAYNGSGEFLAGTLDEFRIWNVARTPLQIRENIHCTLTGTESGLVGYWQLNEGNGSTTTNDQAGHGYSGTLTNFQFDASDGQVPSTVSVGAGTGSSQDNFQTGTAAVGTVSLSMIDDFDNPVTIVGTQINSLPNVVPSTSGVNLDDRYWAITSHGTPGVFSANLTFTVPATFTSGGSAPGSVYMLYHRDGNSEGNWTEAVNGAASVTATTITFNGITSFSQFFIGSSDALLPVELVSFTAAAKGKVIELAWKTATEVDNYGFEVERKQIPLNSPLQRGSRAAGEAGGFVKVGFIQGHGTTNSPKSYSFIDATAKGKVIYRLKQIDNDGKFEYSNAVEVTISSPREFALMQNYPNPFNPTTKIGFMLPVSGFVSLKIYDMLGKEIQTLVNEVREEGEYAVEFNAGSLSSGIYFYTLRTDNFNETKKMLLFK